MPSVFMQVVLAGGMLLVALLAMLSLFRGFRRYLRQAKYRPVEPVVEVNPPEAVVKTAGLELVAWVAILWSVANLAILVVAALTLQERPMLSSVPVQLAVMVYVLVATILAGWGGVLLLKLMPYGRRAVAWGAALFCIFNVFGFAVCLFLRQYEDVSLDVQRLAMPVAVVLAVHTLIDTAIGVAAQHVGLASGQEGEQGPASGGAR